MLDPDGLLPTGGLTMPHDQFLDPPVSSVIAQWRHYARVLAPGRGQHVLDVGCGSGDPAALLLRLCPDCACVVGLDLSAERLGRARRHAGPRLAFVRGDGRRLPFPDDSFDRVLSADALEWVRPPLDAVREMRRVLRPGGRAVLIHTDFDSQIVGGVDAALTREIVHGFSDAGPNGTIGRELPGLAREAGFARARVEVYTLVEEEFRPGLYVWDVVKMMRLWFAARPTVSAERFARWVAAMEAATATGRYFYAVNRVICVCE
jgi:ubiquinone/menaquinone biosynthesis C-methylase UbiE